MDRRSLLRCFLGSVAIPVAMPIASAGQSSPWSARTTDPDTRERWARGEAGYYAAPFGEMVSKSWGEAHKEALAGARGDFGCEVDLVVWWVTEPVAMRQMDGSMSEKIGWINYRVFPAGMVPEA